MSEVASTFPDVHGFPRKYPWERWTDGCIHVLTRGEDFDVSTYSFRHAAHNHADRNGFRVRTSTRGERVWLQFMRVG